MVPQGLPVPPISLGVIVSNFIEERSVLAALLNIRVVNVRAPTGLSIVIFVPSARNQSPTPTFEDSPTPPAATIPDSLLQLGLPTPVKISSLMFFLAGYDHSVVQFLSHGFTEGFLLHHEGPRYSCDAPNLLSAIENPAIVDEKIAKELAAHRLAGPFSSPPFPDFRISPLGLVPKKTEGEFRLIHHLSYPKGSSLNEGISEEHSSDCYATVEDAIRTLKWLAQVASWLKLILRTHFASFPFTLRIIIF